MSAPITAFTCARNGNTYESDFPDEIADRMPENTPNGVNSPRRNGASLLRRKTWPRLSLCISDIIYWDDGDAEEIGEGFYSNVYKFLHRPSGHTVVVKASKGEFTKDEEDEAVMIKEIKLLKKLSHENIIKYLGLCAKDGKFHPVLEFINGGGLDRLLVDDTVKISWSEKIGFCHDVAKGMQYLHTNHIFHRDLKSSNCLVRYGEGGTRTVVVADFGLAREVRGDMRTPRKMSVVGTAFWMAPELLTGKLYNIKADVFSYGILACEILARVISDPDDLPRTPNFGLDSEKFGEKCPDCPEQLMELVKECTEVNNPLSRPGFDQILETLEELSKADDTSDYDVTDDFIEMRISESNDCDEQNNNSLSKASCSCGTNHSNFIDLDNSGSKLEEEDHEAERHHRHSGLSDDSGFGDCVERLVNGNVCPTCQRPGTVGTVTKQSRARTRHDDVTNNNRRPCRKKVSFKLMSLLLLGRRRFKNDVIHEDVAPSRGMSLRRSASLPDLKNQTTDQRKRSATVNNISTRNTRPKSCYYAGNS